MIINYTVYHTTVFLLGLSHNSWRLQAWRRKQTEASKRKHTMSRPHTYVHVTQTTHHPAHSYKIILHHPPTKWQGHLHEHVHSYCRNTEASFQVHAIEGSGLSITQAISPNQNVTNNIPSEKPQELWPCLAHKLKAQQRTTNKSRRFPTKPSEWATAPPHQWWEASAVIKRGKWQSPECWV